ncbi:MAG: NAD-dependent protein deacylase [Gammaproteobacteria bacterium]|nr:NAD-dependent protein deacylase [Gammaproteobacteria bacterium]
MLQTDARRIVVLTGAGISKESGLDTFRDPDGIWSQVRLEDVATPEAFERDPARVHAFYNARRRGLLSDDVRPNAAHEALARLEAEWPGEVLLVTQNIDDLHERAGSQNLIHMHGEILKARCLRCGNVTPWAADLDLSTACPACGELGRLRVHVVWFGEMPFEMDRILTALETCDLFVSIGTSGSVYPAAGFVQDVRMRGRAHTVELNLQPSEGHSLFAERRYGPAGRVVPEFVDKVLSEGW